MGDPGKVIFEQFAKDIDKSPGWGYLLALVMVWLNFIGLPKEMELPAWFKAPLTYELIAVVVTFLSYKIGDSLDEAVFKEWVDGKWQTRKCFKDRYSNASVAATGALEVGESGLYSLCSNLVAAAEKERGTRCVYFSNEIAKLMRSLGPPMVLLGGIYLCYREWTVGIILIVSGPFIFCLYPGLKVLHIRKLYSLAAHLKTKPKYGLEVGKDTNLYFWDSKFVTAARRA